MYVLIYIFLLECSSSNDIFAICKATAIAVNITFFLIWINIISIINIASKTILLWNVNSKYLLRYLIPNKSSIAIMLKTPNTKADSPLNGCLDANIPPKRIVIQDKI